MLPMIAVTGSTGRVGSRVARHLSAAGVEQRLIVRDALRAPDLPGAAVAVAEYRDPAAARRALSDVGTLFMVSAAEQADRLDEHRTFIDAARAARVAQVVYLSFFGAGPECTFTLGRDHWATEEHLRASGMRWTFLRDNLYADFVPLMLQDGELRGPAEEGRAAMVAIADIAEAAAAVLQDAPPHAGRTYSLTGPDSMTLAQVAETLTSVTGRPARYVPETVAEAYASRAHYGAPDWQMDAWVSTYTAIAAGELERVTRDVEILTGHPATPLADVLRAAATA
jgi:uncharacterized protein YbjT (DUF2867 family)